MDAFSLLKYWRTTTNASDSSTNADVSTPTNTNTNTIVTTVSSQPSESGDEENDYGPFFDLEFSLPLQENEPKEQEQEQEQEGAEDNYCEEDEEESDCLSGESTEDVNLSVSPSYELFFNNGFVPVEQITDEIKSKSLSLQSHASLTKPATKFRVMMLKFTKLKTNDDKNQNTESNTSNSKEEQKKNEMEHVPIVSFFKRRNSLITLKKRQNDVESVSSSSDEKKFSKETMQRYLKKVKPLYVRVSKRYGETAERKHSLMTNVAIDKESKLDVSEPPLLNNNNIKALRQGNLPAGLRVVCKQLRKSRSGFTAVATAPPGVILSNRRDDSLLQQQDGIQSAILHCKRSFKASRDSDCSSSSGGDPAPQDGNSLSSEEKEEINKK